MASEADNRWIGQRTIRPDGEDKVTGRAAFGADFAQPGMLWGKVLRSPHPHARIKSINLDGAATLDGVKAVMSGADLVNFPLDAPVLVGPADMRFVSRNVMARDKALYAGHAVAAVAATSAQIAEAALDAGADLVNDVSALAFDPAMAGLVAERGVPICLMHAQGEPPTMQDAPYYEDVSLEIFGYLQDRIRVAEAAGIARERIIVDPGIGFGKTLQHNLTLLQGLSLYHDLGVPLLLGVSRKGVIGMVGGASRAKDRLPGSLAAALHCVAQGVHMLRVHDVVETGQALDVHIAMNGGEWNGR